MEFLFIKPLKVKTNLLAGDGGATNTPLPEFALAEVPTRGAFPWRPCVQMDG